MLEFKLGFVRLGRDPGCELRVEGDGAAVVSSLHAQFGERQGRWFLEDLFSRNGTLLEGTLVPPGKGVPVVEGQVVQLGRTGPQFRVMRTSQRLTAATLVEATLDSGAVAVLTNWQATTSSEQSSVTTGESDAATDAAADDAPPEPAVWMTLALPEGEPFALTGRSARIGRSAACEIVVGTDANSVVSRVHAELAVRPDGSVLVVDAGSTHGTFVNGERVELARVLVVGDSITLGRGGPSVQVLSAAKRGGA
jgi:pSer/pThr/pTyr-binding forkhead associated (FHA) protein